MRIIKKCEGFNKTRTGSFEIVENPDGSGKLKAKININFVPMPPPIATGEEPPVITPKKPEIKELEGVNPDTLTSEAKQYIIEQIGEIDTWLCK